MQRIYRSIGWCREYSKQCFVEGDVGSLGMTIFPPNLTLEVAAGIDADPQGTATEWADAEELPFP